MQEISTILTQLTMIKIMCHIKIVNNSKTDFFYPIEFDCFKNKLKLNSANIFLKVHTNIN